MMRARGFTLIELLVAVFLLAVLSAFAYGTLSYVQKAREATQTNFAREREVELAISTIVTDFEQVAPRPVRQPLGTDYLPAVYTDPRGQDLVALTRLGWSNSAGLARANMQRVTYRFDKDRKVLVRAYTNVLDAPLSVTPVTRDLLTGVESVELRFLPIGAAAAQPNGLSTGLSPSGPNAGAGSGAFASAPVPISNDPLSANWLTQWPAPGAPTGAVPAGAPAQGANGTGTGTATTAGTTAGGTAAAGTTQPVALVLPRARPRAVQVTIVLTDFGRIVRLIEVPG